ncbi:MAG TPA: hypothetical protein EYG51_16720 [Pseudomonadales bacterium]|nr:hypothetical protein [Pseudomonadales bacterium]
MKFPTSESSLKSDWARVSQNPDNLILSDSLKVLLDDDQVSSVGASVQISLPAKLLFSNKEIDANLYSYACSADEIRYSFKIKAQDLGIILSSEGLTSLFITDNLNSFNYRVDMLPADEKPEISFDLVNSPSTDANLNIKIFK